MAMSSSCTGTDVTTEVTDFVIGSGPAGIAAAHALLARGRMVIMLDGGKDLEPTREAARGALAARDPQDWSDTDRADWQAPQFAGLPGQVRRYGSDFAMQPATDTFADPASVALRASYAIGGLSSLWGSAVLPYAEPDMAGWPITPEDLAPHYKAVAGFMPMSGQADVLEYVFPSFPMAGRTPIPASVQATELLRRLALRRTAITALGIQAGAARQAVAPGCRLCGQCLHGCPFGLIWSARHAVADLRANPGFTHRPGAIVRHITETPDGVAVTLADGTMLTGTRAYLGAGVLETARIILASGYAQSLTLRDSQQAFLPALQGWTTPRPDRGQFHTLPQAFLELFDPSLSPHLVHAQVYTWNEYYARDLIAQYGRILPAPLLRTLARRLIVTQAFLHSDHSAKIHLTLAPDGRLVARTEAAADTSTVMTAALRRLSAALRLSGLFPLAFAARYGAPGASFHVGASLPMSAAPGAGQSDTLGRPFGLSRLHLIDASSLPAIPATTITFSVMANAHRIGSAKI